MRRISLIAAALTVLLAEVLAQGWIDYVSRADLFAVNFPGEPGVREVSYRSEYFLELPGRVYSFAEGPDRHSVTVVDYSNTEKMHAERLKTCKADLGDGDSCNNPWRTEMRGAIVHATWNFLERGGKLTHLTYTTADLVEGNQLQLVNTDGSRTFAAIHMHENRLYILESTMAAGMPAPGLFQQSLQFLDKEGNRIRYQSPYTNGFPPPPHIRYR